MPPGGARVGGPIHSRTMACCDLGAYWKARAGGRELSIRAIAREPRVSAIPRAEDAVHRHGGDVLDFKMFSNVSLNLLVELDGAGAVALADGLASLGWHVELDPDRAALASRARDRLEGTFQVTFPEGDGDLVVRLPNVPG